ncbi:MAG: hypothetical protein ACOYKE_05285 [Ferruginibacter sp.]
MYQFTVKYQKEQTQLFVMRALLSMATIACFVLVSEVPQWLRIGCGILLIVLSLFTEMIMAKFKIKFYGILIIAALLLFCCTLSFAIPIVLLVIGAIVLKLFTAPIITINTTAIVIQQKFSKSVIQWNELSNVLLKDGLLTIDFNNNTLFQVAVENQEAANFDSAIFNAFCKTQLESLAH